MCVQLCCPLFWLTSKLGPYAKETAHPCFRVYRIIWLWSPA